MEGFTKLEHQAAGHDGILVDESGALFIKPSTEQEIEFYTQVQELDTKELRGEDGEEEDDEELAEGSRLLDFMPLFLGTLESGITNKVRETTEISEDIKKLDLENSKEDKKAENPYLVINNILYGYKNPSIIDIKLGSILHDENTPDEKRDRLSKVSESTTSGSLNYRVCGQKLYHDKLPDLSKFDPKWKDQVIPDDDGYIVFNKWFGRALTEENVVENFKIYFRHNKLSKDQQDVLLRNFFTRIQLLYNCLLDYEVRLRSASLFFVYENDPERWNELDSIDPLFPDNYIPEDEEDEEELPLTSLSSMSLIDFAHSKFTPGEGPDENVILGVENLMNALEKLLEMD